MGHILAQARVLPMPPPDPPEYLRFQRHLQASEQISQYLAPALRHVHWLYEGWDDSQLSDPVMGEIKRIYEQHACYMVRFCSEPERQVATSRAERWGLHAMDALQDNLKLVESPEQAEKLIRTYVRQCLDVQRFALMHGVGKLTPQEQALLAEANGD